MKFTFTKEKKEFIAEITNVPSASEITTLTEAQQTKLIKLAVTHYAYHVVGAKVRKAEKDGEYDFLEFLSKEASSRSSDGFTKADVEQAEKWQAALVAKTARLKDDPKNWIGYLPALRTNLQKTYPTKEFVECPLGCEADDRPEWPEEEQTELRAECFSLLKTWAKTEREKVSLI